MFAPLPVAGSVQTAPLLSVTAPVNVIARVLELVELKFIVPVIFVAPDTQNTAKIKIVKFLVIVNFFTLAIFGIDKLNSKKGGWRIPESKLLLIAFFGPFGAYAGMLLFRHKTRKIKFLIVPFFLFIQGFLIMYFYFSK